jgi:hypothetical protein
MRVSDFVMEGSPLDPENIPEELNPPLAVKIPEFARTFDFSMPSLPENPRDAKNSCDIGKSDDGEKTRESEKSMEFSILSLPEKRFETVIGLDSLSFTVSSNTAESDNPPDLAKNPVSENSREDKNCADFLSSLLWENANDFSRTELGENPGDFPKVFDIEKGIDWDITSDGDIVSDQDITSDCDMVSDQDIISDRDIICEGDITSDCDMTFDPDKPSDLMKGELCENERDDINELDLLNSAVSENVCVSVIVWLPLNGCESEKFVLRVKGAVGHITIAVQPVDLRPFVF